MRVMLFLHGESGGWDELLIALVAFVVLWAAVKLAGRKPADVDESDDGEDAAADAADGHADSAQPPATKFNQG
jgi:hypothetical protein